MFMVAGLGAAAAGAATAGASWAASGIAATSAITANIVFIGLPPRENGGTGNGPYRQVKHA